jgi:hypothetical protein
MKVRLTLGTSLGLLLVAGAASAAQPWLADRRYGEGIGLRAGRFEFHPGVSAEFGYDSNFFQRADTIDPPPEDAFRLRVTPSVTMSTLTERRLGSQPAGAPPMLTMNANAFVSYSEIFGSDEVSDQRNVDAGIGAKVDIAPKRPFGVDFYGDYLRNGEPSNLADVDQAFDRGQLRGGLGVTWRPGGGLFDWRVGYEAAYSYFEDQPFNRLQNLQHSILTRGRWRILPRSGFLYDAKYTFVRYLKDSSPQPSGDTLTARLGFSGLITTRVAFMVLGGWSSTFYERDVANTAQTTLQQNYDGYVGQAELKYFVMAGPDGGSDSASTGLSSIAAGFTRDATTSYLAAFYTRDRGYLNFEYFLGGMFVANLQGGFALYSFPEVSAANGAFTQKHIDAGVFAEYRLSDTFGINFTGLYDQSLDKGPNERGIQVFPDDPLTAEDESIHDNLEYKRIQAMIGLRLFW